MTKPPLLGEFIRAHRERITPAQVGMPPGLRRRAKGLRREEVATLCDISPTWLTWIEQGRDISISPGTLARIATALMLTAAEREYLFDLAGLRDPDEPEHINTTATQQILKQAVDNIASPAYVLDRVWNVLAWNTPAGALFAEWLDDTSDITANLLHFMFLDHRARTLVADWHKRAHRLVAEFRADASAELEQAALQTFLDDLRSRSSEFDALWRQQHVLEREGGERTFHHPSLGDLIYQQLTLRVAHSPELKMVMLLPASKNPFQNEQN